MSTVSKPVALADWDSHEYLLVGWPTRPDTWRAKAGPAQAAILRFVRKVLHSTTSLRVAIVADDDEIVLTNAREQCKLIAKASHPASKTRLEVIPVPLDDCWLRDTGPIMLSGRTASSFRFNAWGGALGGCYSSFVKDAQVATRICEWFALQQIVVDMVLEGGSVNTDGQGTVLTTKECLLNPNRNPGLSLEEIETVLRHSLGAKKVIWLEYGAAFDTDADGHIDNLAVFIAPTHVLLLWADEKQCMEQYRRSMAALEVLKDSVDALGRQLAVSLVTIPAAIIRTKDEAGGLLQEEDAKKRPMGERVCASYVNFVVVEDTVIAPRFGDEQSDAKALRELRAAFSRYKKSVVMVDAREFVLAGGGLHCLTKSVP